MTVHFKEKLERISEMLNLRISNSESRVAVRWTLFHLVEIHRHIPSIFIAGVDRPLGICTQTNTSQDTPPAETRRDSHSLLAL